MTGMEKKLAFLLATSPHLDTLSGSYDEAARDLVANGVVPVVRCKDCTFCKPSAAPGRFFCDWHRDYFETFPDDFCSHGERRADE